MDRRSFIGFTLASPAAVQAEDLAAFNALAVAPLLDLNPGTIAANDPGPFYISVCDLGFIVNGVMPTMLSGASQTVIHVPSGTVIRDNTGVAPDRWVDIDVLTDTLDQSCHWPRPMPAPAKLGESTEAYEAARKFILFLSRDAQSPEGRARLAQKHRLLIGKSSTYTDWYN